MRDEKDDRFILDEIFHRLSTFLSTYLFHMYCVYFKVCYNLYKIYK